MTLLDLKQIQINSAIGLFSKGEINNALDAVQDLFKDYPNEPLLFNLLGACYKTQGAIRYCFKELTQSLRAPICLMIMLRNRSDSLLQKINQ